jgi:Tol biopolymer transport system component
VRRRHVAPFAALFAVVAGGCAFVTTTSSVPNDGNPQGVYGTPAISGNGRFVAYASRADTKAADAAWAIFVKDHVTGAVEVASVATSGELAEGWSGEPAISNNGRYVAFTSDAENLVASDTNNVGDIFVRDRVAKTTARVSVSSAGAQVNGESSDPSISDDGRYVAFTSDGRNVVPLDSNGWEDVFVRDLVGNTTVRVDVGLFGEFPENGADEPEISGNGRYVAFTTAWPLATGDDNDDIDVYRRDLTNGTTERVSSVSQGGFGGSISNDGRFVSFTSWDRLLAADTNGGGDVYRRDFNSTNLSLVSVGPAGTSPTGQNGRSSIAANGRWVAFSSTANITGTDTNGAVNDVYVRDLDVGRSYVVSTELFLAQANVASDTSRISGDGRYVAFGTAAKLTSGDTNIARDVVVRALVIPEITQIAPASVGRGVPTTITLTGRNFMPGARAMVAGTHASSVTVNNENSITLQVTLPATAALGKADVFVNNLGTGQGPDSGTVGKCAQCVTVT